MDKTEDKIEVFFQEIIFGIIYPQIEQCMNAKANYVVALALLSYTELIGGLASGNLGLEGKSRANFDEALKYFPEAYRKVDSKIKVKYTDGNGKPREDKGIYGVYRCGVVHEFLIKGVNAGVADISGRPANESRVGVSLATTVNSNEKLLTFFPKEYFRDFKSATCQIYKKLVVDCDHKLLEGFNKSLEMYYSREIL